VTSANLVVATGQNARAMNAAVHQVARSVAFGRRVTTELRDRVEATVRAFDPCMSCATHTVVDRAVELRLVGPGEEVLDEWPPAE
jgi:NAD-reducing hydrogenase large subunit